jgi:glutamate synthase domain-containing protein 3
VEFDLANQTLREINQALHDVRNGNRHPESLFIHHPKGAHALAVGLTKAIDVSIEGHVGYYCAGMNKLANIHIHGNAGPGLAENMMSGSVRVDGNASQYVGASGHGGLLVIQGNTSSRCGISMKGIDIVVGGSVGHFSGFMAQSGRLVVCGDTSHDLGDSIYEAQIFVRGEVASLGSDCVEKDMRSEHVIQLDDLLKRAGFDYPGSEFRRFGSARSLYNFKIDNADAL